MKKLLVIILFFAFAAICCAQMQFNKVTPISLSLKDNSKSSSLMQQKSIKPLQELKPMIVHGLNYTALQQELDEQHKQDTSFHPIAKALPVSIDVIKEGYWENQPGKGKICRFKLHIENSSAVVLTFDRFSIPKGSSLLIFNNDGMVLGPITSDMNKPSKKFMTGIIQGPDLVFEYCESTDNSEKAEISINNIGIIFKYDYTQNEKTDSKKGDQLLKIPPVPIDAASDYVNGVREGYLAMCKVADPVNFSDPVGKIVTSACQYLFYYGSWFDSKPAVLIKGNDDCTPYIATAGHVTWPGNNAEEYSVIRFNWVRKLPPNAPQNVQDRNWDNCYYPENTQWNNTIDFSRVIDYLGTTQLRYFPCSQDVAILKINTHLVHKVWLCGWDARDGLDGNSPNNTAVVLSRYAGVPLMYAEGTIFNKREHYTFQPVSFPLRLKSGYSGTPIFYPYKTNNTIDEYLYVGPLVTRDGTVTKLYNAYRCSQNGQQAPLEPILHDPNNPNEFFQLGKWYVPDDCTPLPECCNFYYASTQFEHPDDHDMCCNTFKLEERIIDNLPGHNTCPTYVVKIFHEYDLVNPVSFDIVREDNSVIQSNVQQDNINFNEFKGTIKRYRVCEPLPSNLTSMAKKYIIKFYADGKEVETCDMDLYFTCSKECYCDAERYKIDLIKKGSSNDSACCYTATICKLNDDEHQALTCTSTFIQAWAVNKYSDPNAHGWYYPYKNFRLISNYWFDDSGLLKNPACDPNLEKAVIDDICIENPDENYIMFRFYSEPVLSSYPNFPYSMYCEQAVPVTPCNCCDGIVLEPILFDDECGNIRLHVEQRNSNGCAFSSIDIEAIITDYNGNESSLGLLENITDYEYDINHDITIRKYFSFNSYRNINNDIKYTLSKIKYRIRFKMPDGSVLCTKDIEAKECNDCLENIQFTFSSTSECSTNVHVYEIDHTYPRATFEKYESDGIWYQQGYYNFDNPNDNLQIQGDKKLGPGIYRIKFGYGYDYGCCFYFKIDDCWQCHPNGESYDPEYLWVTAEKIPGSCCYEIKSNKSASVTVDDIDNQQTSPCSLTRTGTAPNYNYSNPNCELLCNKGSNEKKLKLTFNNVFGTYDCERIIVLPPCNELSECCKAAQIEVITSPGNNSGEVCCFKFNIHNVGCSIAKVKFYRDERTDDGDHLTTVYTSNMDLDHLADNMDWICCDGTTPNHTAYIVLVDENGAECSMTPVSLEGCHTREKACCNAINAQIVPSNDCVDCPSGKCCFKFIYSTLPDCNGLPLKIKIIYNSNTIYESSAPETLHQNGTINLCIDRTLLPASPNSQNISVRVEFNIGDNTYCSKEGISLHIDSAQCTTCCNDFEVQSYWRETINNNIFTCCWLLSLTRNQNSVCSQPISRIHIKDTRPVGYPPGPLPADEYDISVSNPNTFPIDLGIHCTSFRGPEGMASINTEITIYDASGNIICDKILIRNGCVYGIIGWSHTRDIDSAIYITQLVHEYSDILTNLRVIPNPSQEDIVINYNLNENIPTKIEISNSLGSMVGNISENNTSIGIHSIPFSFKELPSGVYYIKVTAEGCVSTIRVSVIK